MKVNSKDKKVRITLNEDIKDRDCGFLGRLRNLCE